MYLCKTLGLGAALACAITSTSLAGPEWVESGDAGPLIGNAQNTQGKGQLGRISGSLGGLGFGAIDTEDMYLVTVTDPVTFTMTITGGSFDAQLFIFNVTQPGEAFGLLANDNTNAGIDPFVNPIATDGSGAQLTVPGVYAVAISGAGRYPVSNGGAIFNFTNSTEISGPDGPGGFLPHIGWAGSGATGGYHVDLEGTGFYEVPAPGAVTMLLIGGFGNRRRRRR